MTAEHQTESQSTCLCVLGMHRSGTSALARVLNLLGADLGENLLPASADNPKGFWERRDLVAIHNEILDAVGSSYDDFFALPDGWWERPAVEPLRQQLLAVVRQDFAGRRLWGFKDPRTCRLLRVWTDVFARAGVAPGFVFVVRPPAEIARSLAGRNGWPLNKSLLLTLAYLLDAERETRPGAAATGSGPSAPRVVVTYDGLLQDWRATADRIAAALGLAWPVDPSSAAVAIRQFLDPTLRHHRPGTADAASGPFDADLLRQADELHEIFAAAAATADGRTIDTERVDRLRAAFDADRPRLGGWREFHSLDRKLARAESWAQELNQTVAALRAENEALQARAAGAANGDGAKPAAGAGSAGSNGSGHAPAAAAAAAATDAQVAQLHARVTELDLARLWATAQRDAAQRAMNDLLATNARLSAQVEALGRERSGAVRRGEEVARQLAATRVEIAAMQLRVTEALARRDALAAEMERLQACLPQNGGGPPDGIATF